MHFAYVHTTHIYGPGVILDTHIQGGPKKPHTILLSISLLNIDRFSQFFHRRTQLEICNKTINKDPTSPQMCCYTTLWNVNVQKSLYTIQSLMVSVGVSELGCTHLIFVDLGVKINGCYYREVLLSQQLLPAIWQVSGDFFMFQQDIASAHSARETIKLLQWEMPAFISLDLWPPNSPNLNPVHYKIWGVMQDRVYQKKSEGRGRVERVTDCWGLGETATEHDDAIDQWHRCLRSG